MPRARRGELRGVFRVLHERKVAGRRAVERRDAADAPRGGVPARDGAGERRDLLRCQPVRALEEMRFGHATLAVAGADLEPGAAAEAQLLDAVVRVRGDRKRIVDADRTERRIPDDAGADR